MWTNLLLNFLHPFIAFGLFYFFESKKVPIYLTLPVAILIASYIKAFLRKLLSKERLKHVRILISTIVQSVVYIVTATLVPVPNNYALLHILVVLGVSSAAVDALM